MIDNLNLLWDGETGQDYMITDIRTEEDGMREFLFTLGCYPGEKITIISHLSKNLIANIKDARYSMDETLASAIVVNTGSGMEAGASVMVS